MFPLILNYLHSSILKLNCKYLRRISFISVHGIFLCECFSVIYCVLIKLFNVIIFKIINVDYIRNVRNNSVIIKELMNFQLLIFFICILHLLTQFDVQSYTTPCRECHPNIDQISLSR